MVKKVDGHFNMVQYGRLDIPVAVMRKLDIFLGWGEYKEIKKKFKAIPPEKRKFPYVMASKVIVMFHPDLTEKEVITSLEFLLSELKNRWKEELQQTTQ